MYVNCLMHFYIGLFMFVLRVGFVPALWVGGGGGWVCDNLYFVINRDH